MRWTSRWWLSLTLNIRENETALEDIFVPTETLGHLFLLSTRLLIFTSTVTIDISKIWNPLKRVKFSRFFRPSTNCTQAFWTSQGYEHSKVLGCRAKQPQDKGKSRYHTNRKLTRREKNSLKMTCNLSYVIEVSKDSRDERRQEIWKLIWNEHVHKREETKTQMRHLSSWMSAENSLQPEIQYSLISCQDKCKNTVPKINGHVNGLWSKGKGQSAFTVSVGIVISSITQSQLNKLLLATFYTPGI